MVKLSKAKSIVFDKQPMDKRSVKTADDLNKNNQPAGDDLLSQLRVQVPPATNPLASSPSDPVQTINSNQADNQIQSSQISGYGGIGVKEKEIFAQQDEIQLEELRKELEVPPEVVEAGVEVKHDEIELPDPVKKMGVTTSDFNQPAIPVTSNLPINDDKIVTGLGAPVVSSLRWLVEWCVRQLKRVHIRLKKVHGQIIRVVSSR